MRTRSARLLFVLGVLVVGPQCKPRAHGAGADASASNDEGEFSVVHVKGGDETRVRLGAGAIPSEFPPGMQLYPGATFSSTSHLKSSVVIILHTPDSPEAVFAFYRAQPGYEETSDVVVKQKRVLSLKHRTSGKDLQIVVEAGGGRTEVSLVGHTT